MRPSLAHPYKPAPWIRVALLAALTLLSSGWTCSAIFLSCQGLAQSQVTSLSPDTIPIDAESALLTVDGSGFTSQSQIMWNGNALPTTFMDSQHLQILPQIERRVARFSSSLAIRQSVKESILAANVKSVYGEPIAAQGKTVIPWRR